MNNCEAKLTALLFAHHRISSESLASGVIVKDPASQPSLAKDIKRFRETNNMTNQGLMKLYVDELRDLYNAENQLIKALPKMAKAASSGELRQGFEAHLKQTEGHVERLEKIFESIGQSSKGKKCAGMEGLVVEGSQIMHEDFEGAVMDAALIGAAQRVEHYEIAAYGTVRELAQVLGQSKHASLLEQTLKEEKETDAKLTALATEINQEANEESEEGSTRKKSVA